MDTIQLLAELEMANKAVSKWQATAELHRLELSTLKAILEKKDEALRKVREKCRPFVFENGKVADIWQWVEEALTLTPETYVKEEGKV